MPYFGSTLFFVALAALYVVSLSALMLLGLSLAPSFIERAAEDVERRPARCALTGAAVFGLTLLFAAVAGAGGPVLKVVSLLALALVTGLAAFGLSAVAARVGANLWGVSEARSPYRQVLRGGLVTLLAALVPFFGWLVIAPLALVVAVGASTRAALRRAQRHDLTQVEPSHVAS